MQANRSRRLRDSTACRLACGSTRAATWPTTLTAAHHRPLLSWPTSFTEILASTRRPGHHRLAGPLDDQHPGHALHLQLWERFAPHSASRARRPGASSASLTRACGSRWALARSCAAGALHACRVATSSLRGMSPTSSIQHCGETRVCPRQFLAALATVTSLALRHLGAHAAGASTAAPCCHAEPDFWQACGRAADGPAACRSRCSCRCNRSAPMVGAAAQASSPTGSAIAMLGGSGKRQITQVPSAVALRPWPGSRPGQPLRHLRQRPLGVAVEAPGAPCKGDAAPGHALFCPGSWRASAGLLRSCAHSPCTSASPWLVEQMAMQGVSGRGVVPGQPGPARLGSGKPRSSSPPRSCVVDRPSAHRPRARARSSGASVTPSGEARASRASG